jgi:hypothetical protein
MVKADDNQNKLTQAERDRNKRSGDINLYFVQSKSSALRRIELGEGEKYEASFKSKDEVAGNITGSSALIIG